MGGICTRDAASKKKELKGAQRKASGVLSKTSGSCCISGYAGATLGNKKHQVVQCYISVLLVFMSVLLCITSAETKKQALC
jgi:hypothetical protein